MSLTIRIALARQDTFELHCGPRSRPVDRAQTEALAATADRDYFGDGQPDPITWAPRLPDLIALGKSLYTA